MKMKMNKIIMKLMKIIKYKITKLKLNLKSQLSQNNNQSQRTYLI